MSISVVHLQDGVANWHKPLIRMDQSSSLLTSFLSAVPISEEWDQHFERRLQSFALDLIKKIGTQSIASEGILDFCDIVKEAAFGDNPKIQKAFYKPRGYLSRFFSTENWEEWTERHTALGKVSLVFFHSVEQFTESKAGKRLDKKTIEKAFSEASLLKAELIGTKQLPGGEVDSKKVVVKSSSHCGIGMFVSAWASLMTQTPLPLLLGLSNCASAVSADPGLKKNGPAFRINSPGQAAKNPAITALTNGDVAIAWAGAYDATNWNVYSRVFRTNGYPLKDELLNVPTAATATSNPFYCPGLVSLSKGNFILGMYSRSASLVSHQLKVYDQHGDPAMQLWPSSGEIPILDNGLFNSRPANPPITVFNDTFVSIHNNIASGVHRLAVNAQDLNPVFQGTGSAVALSSANYAVTPITNIKMLSSSLLDSGKGIVTWMGKTGGYFDIYAQQYWFNGTFIGAPFKINELSYDDNEFPAVTGLSGGNYAIAWGRRNPLRENTDIIGRIFNATNSPLTSEFAISTDTSVSHSKPGLTRLDNGSFAVVWEYYAQNQQGIDVYGQIVNDTGILVGNNFKINTYDVGDQYSPAAAYSNNKLIAVWTSSSEGGIYGQALNVSMT